MRQLKAFIKKEFLHVFRDTRTMLILFGMPVVQIILFGFAISTEVRNIDIAVVVPQSSEVTRRLTEKFDASEYFTVRRILRSTDGIEKYFRDGSINMADIYGWHAHFGQGVIIRRFGDDHRIVEVKRAAPKSEGVWTSLYKNPKPDSNDIGLEQLEKSVRHIFAR